MRKSNLFPWIALVLMLALAACSSSQIADNVMSGEDETLNGPTVLETSDEMGDNSSDSMDENMPEEMSDEMSNGNSDEMMEEEMEDSSNDMMDESQSNNTQETPEEMAEDAPPSPAWVGFEFTDAVTGEVFSISEFRGKVVLVETMAMWCSNCLKQQKQVRELHSLLGERDDFQSIGIDVDPNEDIVRLSDYVVKNEFDWLYSVAPPEVLAGIQESLGGQFLNPPSTPIVLFDKEGQPHPLPFGIKSADELLSYVEMYLN